MLSKKSATIRHYQQMSEDTWKFLEWTRVEVQRFDERPSSSFGKSTFFTAPMQDLSRQNSFRTCIHTCVHLIEKIFPCKPVDTRRNLWFVLQIETLQTRFQAMLIVFHSGLTQQLVFQIEIDLFNTSHLSYGRERRESDTASEKIEDNS